MAYSGMDVVGESRRLKELYEIIRCRYDGQLPERGEFVTTAYLVPEPGNPADPDAIAVLVSDLQVGYIPRDRTGIIHAELAAAGADWLAVEATIGWARLEAIGVRLTGIDEDLGELRWEGSGVFEQSQAQQSQGSRFATGNKWVWVLAAVVVLAVIAATLAPRYIDDFGTTVWAYVLWAVMIAGYLLPTIIAGRRRHQSLGAIIAVNLLLGWTLVGWLIALVWSLSAVHNPYQQQVLYQPLPPGQPGPVQYQVGDVVNGHRWNGQTWVPLR